MLFFPNSLFKCLAILHQKNFPSWRNTAGNFCSPSRQEYEAFQRSVCFWNYLALSLSLFLSRLFFSQLLRVCESSGVIIHRRVRCLPPLPSLLSMPSFLASSFSFFQAVSIYFSHFSLLFLSLHLFFFLFLSSYSFFLSVLHSYYCFTFSWHPHLSCQHFNFIFFLSLFSSFTFSFDLFYRRFFFPILRFCLFVSFIFSCLSPPFWHSPFFLITFIFFPFLPLISSSFILTSSFTGTFYLVCSFFHLFFFHISRFPRPPPLSSFIFF